MKRHLLGAVMGALALAAIPISASADPIPGDPVLEGSSTSVGTSGGESVGTCKATLTGSVAASTGVVCELYRDGVLVDSSARAYPGPAAATVVSATGTGVYTICWHASALTMDNEFLTESGC